MSHSLTHDLRNASAVLSYDSRFSRKLERNPDKGRTDLSLPLTLSNFTRLEFDNSTQKNEIIRAWIAHLCVTVLSYLEIL